MPLPVIFGSPPTSHFEIVLTGPEDGLFVSRPDISYFIAPTVDGFSRPTQQAILYMSVNGKPTPRERSRSLVPEFDWIGDNGLG